MIKKIGILTSGGDAPGMNAAIRAVTRVALRNGIKVVGINDGYKGLLNRNFIEFEKRNVSDILTRGGTILGSARFPEFKDEKIVDQAASILKEEGIDGLVVIGGDGSYKGALSLCRHGIHAVGLPGTIDNDISGTDYTIGFETALETIVDCVDKIRDTSSSHHRASVVEVMGNHCGDLALFAGICCGAEIVITPEFGYDEEKIIERLKGLESMHKRHAIILVTEKLTDVERLAKVVTANTGFVGRSTILGHVQRGGTPCPRDRVLASRMGEKAVEVLMAGDGGKCIGIIDDKYVAMPFEDALIRPRVRKKDFYELFEDLV